MHYARIILTLTLAFLALADPWPAAAEEEFVTALTGKFPPSVITTTKGTLPVLTWM